MEREVDRQMKIEEFIQMLQEREIREEILRIVKDGKNNILNVVSGKDVVENYKSENEFVGHKLDDSGNLPQTAEMSAKEIDSKLKTENNQLKAENHEMRDKIKQVQKTCFEVQNHIKQVEEELKNKQNDIIRLNSSLENAQKQINDLQTESKDWEKKYKDEKRNIATVSKRFQEKIVSLQNKIGQLEENNHYLKENNESIQKQMEQRFPQGWELFEAYQNVNKHTKQILHNGVFTKEANFMSFICGGAQTSSLEKLWDALKECIMSGNEKDAQILWDIFEYCIELVNSSKTQATYEILPVTEGDKFDLEIHTEGPNSSAQGKVINIYLPGYRNTYNNKIIRKSIVQVG